jgi:hypothetical protein
MNHKILPGTGRKSFEECTRKSRLPEAVLSFDDFTKIY